MPAAPSLYLGSVPQPPPHIKRNTTASLIYLAPPFSDSWEACRLCFHIVMKLFSHVDVLTLDDLLHLPSRDHWEGLIQDEGCYHLSPFSLSATNPVSSQGGSPATGPGTSARVGVLKTPSSRLITSSALSGAPSLPPMQECQS